MVLCQNDFLGHVENVPVRASMSSRSQYWKLDVTMTSSVCSLNFPQNWPWHTGIGCYSHCCSASPHTVLKWYNLYFMDWSDSYSLTLVLYLSIYQTSICHLTVYLNLSPPLLPVAPLLICYCCPPPSQDAQNNDGHTNSCRCVPDPRWYWCLRGQRNWRSYSSHIGIETPLYTSSLKGPTSQILPPPLQKFSRLILLHHCCCCLLRCLGGGNPKETGRAHRLIGRGGGLHRLPTGDGSYWCGIL